MFSENDFILFTQEISEIPLDSFSQWQRNNQLSILKQAFSIVEGHQLEQRKISSKTFYTIMNACSFEDDINMQKRWVVLLINAITKANTMSSQSYFTLANTLNQMTLEEMEILLYLWEQYVQDVQKETFNFSQSLLSSLFKNNFRLSPMDIEISLQKLIKENIIEQQKLKMDIDHHENNEAIQENIDQFHFTSYGLGFVKECHTLLITDY